MDGTGLWTFLDEQNELDTETYYKDMRRFGSGGSWLPTESSLNINGTTTGCLEMTRSGLFNVKLDEECEESRKPACEYRGKHTDGYHEYLSTIGFM